MKHSQYPWKVFNLSNEAVGIHGDANNEMWVKSDDGSLAVQVSIPTSDKAQSQLDIANAHLIAASPVLLKMCKKFLDMKMGKALKAELEDAIKLAEPDVQLEHERRQHRFVSMEAHADISNACLQLLLAAQHVLSTREFRMPHNDFYKDLSKYLKEGVEKAKGNRDCVMWNDYMSTYKSIDKIPSEEDYKKYGG